MTRPISVLLVDDNELVRESVGAWLEDDGFVIHAVSRGEDALCLLAHTPIDVVLADLTLPGMGGEEFIARAMKDHPDSGYIIHTGSASYRLSLKLQELGLKDDDVVYKPVVSLGLLTGLIRRKTLRGDHNAGQARDQDTDH